MRAVLLETKVESQLEKSEIRTKLTNPLLNNKNKERVKKQNKK